LERGIFPSGASTKNAGFACFGSLTEIIEDLEALSESEVRTLVERRFQGLLSIRKIFGDSALGYELDHGFELITEKELPALEQLSSINQLLAPIFDQEVFRLATSRISFGFGEKVKEVVENPFEGALDSGKFLRCLWKKCNDYQITIHTGAQVEKVLPQEKIVLVKDPVSGTQIKFQGSNLAICTNAFATDLFADLEVKPGRGLILMTSPLPNKIPWKGAFHYDKGYVYFRKIENRIRSSRII
jgi:glycine/D-amino acid oxidase-like deaminating enzyme